MLLEALVICNRDGLKPELRNFPISFNVNMDWFVLIRTEENEAVWTIAQNSRHGLRKARGIPQVRPCISEGRA